MKKVSAITVIVAFFLVVGTLIQPAYASDEPKELALAPVADAFIWGGSNAANNYGKNTYFVVRDATSDAYSRKSYLKFALQDIGTLTSAKLRVYGKATNSPGTVKIMGSEKNDWTETGINWNNAPAPAAEIASTTVSTTANYYEFDVTDYVKNHLDQKEVTFILTGTGKQDIYMDFNSKENGENQPQLVINSSDNGTTVNPNPDAVPDKEFTDLRLKWYTWLVGSSDYNQNDQDIRTAIQSLDESITNKNHSGYWDLMNKNAARTSLWNDAASATNSAHITTSYNRLKSMALAYSTKGSSLYQNSQLKQDLTSALDWMYQNRYNEGKKETGNWWDWEIGSPQALNDIAVLMYDDLSQSQRTNYMKAVQHFVPDPTVRTLGGYEETGANRADKALVSVISGVISKNSEMIFKGQKALSQIFLYVNSGDGFYEDGSFIQHTYVAYTGSYGGVLINRMADLLNVLNDSRWSITDPNVNNLYRWVKESIEPLIYKGAMMDMVRGRAVSRQQEQDHISGRGMIKNISRLSEVAPPDEAAYLKSIVKKWVTEDTSFANYFDKLTISDAIRLKELLNNPSIAPRNELLLNKVYASMDRVVHLQKGYGFGISMFSNRISAFEAGNGENLNGWYTGIGMTSLYNNDLSQFSDNYWATVDMFRLPGITTDGAINATPKDWYKYANPKTWVGGSSIDGLYGTAGMDFSLDKTTGTSLTGKKSWFMFDDEIVALGSGINGNDNRYTETIIENRKINSKGTNELIVNGNKMSNQLGWKETLDKVSWAHLAGNVEGSDIGYYFPKKTTVEGLREARSGSWSQVNTGGSKDLVTNNYLSLAFPHGINPENAAYSYVLLPGKSVKETEEYAKKPDIKILKNTESVHAVKEKELGIIAANFWNPDSVMFIQANNPLSMMLKEEKGSLTLAVSDPTQSQDSLTLELDKQDYAVESKDNNVNIIQTSPTIKVQINTAGSQGKTFTVKFKKMND
ncbi:polysaccharide lyase family 8 super-sandwich domain-containing protein [Neobacillus massiliamazoniensis]|uniref:Hyaluronate lyase n=1 Tax=Neobacillus massiliamazoniensis TaxID=1499688 RepID=A0A0U1NSZ4_9BACI|nr:polysaccharide lyase family 8 super-sandwich domain-containing protein [Neobacillus massiliamazoniensis]CRK81180.1 hyaluronate lyase [Neobacillus massiliamazoniensis]